MSQQENLSSHDRHAEIWATRVQRELLALTTDDAEASSATKTMLPTFVTIQNHALDIATAVCTVDFEADIPVPNEGVKKVVLQLDVSLPKNSDGSLQLTTLSYPFCEPSARLLKGEEFFAPGSTIQNSDLVAIDIEWTPSLHMSDAIVNVALKIKESILQGEPFSAALPVELDPIQEIEQSARRLASSAGKIMTSSLAKAASVLGPSSQVKSPRRPGRKKPVKPKAIEVRIGQEINLLQEPWVDAHGVYACKSIRRPDFVVEAMAQAELKAEPKPSTFSSPVGLFKSMTKKAGSVLQESFLMVTESHIIEMKSSKLNPAYATVTFCITIELMHKLKFRRGESVSLFFKPDPEDPLIYMCPDSGDAVHQIQAVLKRHGVKGKHTNAAAHRAVQEGMQLVQEIQTKEYALKHDPSVERVNVIMNLYRQAAERFEGAGDVRHEEVVSHMRRFLALPLTVSILDGSFKKPEKRLRDANAVPQGEILERVQSQLDDDDDLFSPAGKRALANDTSFEDDIDNLLKEAQADLQQLKSSESSDLEDDSANSDPDGDLADMAADLESMMKAADAELQELMKA